VALWRTVLKSPALVLEHPGLQLLSRVVLRVVVPAVENVVVATNH
jgi:hypothetical protein